MADTPDSPVIHKITANDTLFGLSDHFYGSPLLSDLIKEKNEKEKNITIDPRSLHPGDLLTIPGASQDPDQQYWRQQVRLILSNRNIFHATFQFQGTDETLAPSPVLIPPLPSGAVFGTQFVLSAEGLCRKLEGTTQKVFENDDISFEWKQDPANAQKASDLDAKITIKANNAWKMGEDERKTLRDNFNEFRSAIEKLELEGVFIPGGTAILTQLVAESLPATLEETLNFRYQFNSGFGSTSTPYVDLLPGMRLRLESSASQYIKPASSLNGPVGSGQFFYTLGRNLDQQITFDAFLGSISTPDTPFAASDQTVIGSLIDLHRPGTARRHFRLFYPSQMNLSGFPDDDSKEVTLIGADTLEDLNTATHAFTTDGSTGEASSGNNPIIKFTWRGRSILIPEIEIFITRIVGNRVDHFAQYVPLGTTVRQAIDTMIPIWYPNVLITGRGQPVIVRRLFSMVNGIPAYRQVEFRLSSGVDFEQRLFDLPLAMGDHLEITLKTP